MKVESGSYEYKGTDVEFIVTRASELIDKADNIPTELKPAIKDVISSLEDEYISSLQNLKDFDWPEALSDWVPTIIDALQLLFK
jgi:hypothetical protein